MTTKRLAVYLGLNAIVSAAVTLAVLLVWDAFHSNPDRPAPFAARPSPTHSPTAPARATAQPLVASTPTPVVYTVQPGDTLGSIALEYDVSIEDLMAANGLTDPNILDVGQSLVIPVGGVVSSTPVPEAAETRLAATLTPLPTLTRPADSSAPQLKIRSVVAPGDLAEEAVEIFNEGGAVELAGWTLQASPELIYRFPSLTLFENGVVVVHTRVGVDSVIDLYWDQEGAAWFPGFTVRLLDPAGTEHATYKIP